MPEGETEWRCDECASGQRGASCALCGDDSNAARSEEWPAAERFGAWPMVSVRDGDGRALVHMACALSHDFVAEADATGDGGSSEGSYCQPCEGGGSQLELRRSGDFAKAQKLACSLCGERGGAVQCVHGKCAVAMHPLCAARAGLLRPRDASQPGRGFIAYSGGGVVCLHVRRVAQCVGVSHRFVGAACLYHS